MAGAGSLVARGGLPEAALAAGRAEVLWRGWLRDEHREATQDVAFGIITSTHTAAGRLPLLALWWLPGTVGCLSTDRRIAAPLLAASLPPGLEVCDVPPAIANKGWMNVGAKGRGLHRGAIIHLIIYNRFPGRKWYVAGDDDSCFSPLALVQWLQNFDHTQPWYLGGRSESTEARQRIGWVSSSRQRRSGRIATTPTTAPDGRTQQVAEG